MCDRGNWPTGSGRLRIVSSSILCVPLFINFGAGVVRSLGVRREWFLGKGFNELDVFYAQVMRLLTNELIQLN